MAANMADDYARGLVDAYRELSPQARDVFADELAQAMCEAQTGVQRIVLARMTRWAPSLATRDGLDCLLRSTQSEGAALAATLDAWRHRGFEPTDAYEHWRSSARRPQIQRRFSDDHGLASGRQLRP